MGISYGFQADGQFSSVTVNGTRVTSSAGNFDDGTAGNGALVTVGGVGDSLTNPPDPFNSDDTTDDELYARLSGAAESAQLLLDDIREHPERYIKLSVV